MYDDLKYALTSSGEIFSHKARPDQLVCIFTNKNRALLGFPFQVEQAGDEYIFTIITLYRVTQGELELYRETKTLK